MLTIRARRVMASLVVAVGLAACSSASDTTVETNAPPTPVDADESTSGDAAANTIDPTSRNDATVDDIAEAFVGTSPGGVDVLIERDGTRQRIAAGVGSSDGETLEPGRPFRVGSISKPFVAVMILQLVDEAAVDLDAPLSDYLPDTAVGADATIRQLLSHQSGIPNYTDQPQFLEELFADPTRSITQAEILSFVTDVPLGEVDQFAYSNTNYVLLGQLIEQLDGTDLNASLHERITRPLGLDDTFFDTGNESMPDDLVGGWSSIAGDGDPAAPYEAIASSAWSAGALISTTGDLAGFLGALTGGELVSSDSLTEMTDFGPDGYGFGLFQVSFSPTQTGVGHGGAIPGYLSTMAIDPTTGDILVILTSNDELSPEQLAVRILTDW